MGPMNDFQKDWRWNKIGKKYHKRKAQFHCGNLESTCRKIDYEINWKHLKTSLLIFPTKLVLERGKIEKKFTVQSIQTNNNNKKRSNNVTLGLSEQNK